jgi:HSP20 family protein
MNCQSVTSRNATAFPATLFNLAETFFPGFTAYQASPQARTWAPAVEVTEDATAYTFVAEVANVAAEDVKVSVKDGVLTLKGERKAEPKAEGVRVHFSEISHGTFARSFSLPKDADADSVKAAYKNGLLTVTVGKKAERQPKEITVLAA